MRYYSQCFLLQEWETVVPGIPDPSIFEVISTCLEEVVEFPRFSNTSRMSNESLWIGFKTISFLDTEQEIHLVKLPL